MLVFGKLRILLIFKNIFHKNVLWIIFNKKKPINSLSQSVVLIDIKTNEQLLFYSLGECISFLKSFGFKAPFSKSAVKRVELRDNGVFRRKTLTTKVEGQKMDKYYMYFKISEKSQVKLFNCLCRV